MGDQGIERLFLWLDRGFWVIWAGFPLLVWIIVDGIVGAEGRMAELAPEQAACLANLPQIINFTAMGQAVFWAVFAVEIGFYAVLLGMAHRVIHHCATGRVFMAGMIGTLRAIGLAIALFPVLELVMSNLAMVVYRETGDLPVFLPDYALDLPVIGVGLLMVTMAAAMRLAAGLHRDAALTI